MNSLGILLFIIFITIIFALVLICFSKKAYLGELEKKMGLEEFKMQGTIGPVNLTAKWKGLSIGVYVPMWFPGQPKNIFYRIDHRFKHIATITPSSAILVKEKSAKEKLADEETVRPWRVKLTDEEQKIIDARRGGPAVNKEPEKFNIIANKPEEIAAYFKDEKRSKAMEELFKQGITEIRIGITEIIAVKKDYVNDDMSVGRVDKYFANLKTIIE